MERTGWGEPGTERTMRTKRANGEGGLFFRKTTGRWTAAVVINGRGFSVQPARNRMRRTHLADLLKMRDGDTPLDADRMTVGEYCEHFLRTTKATIRPSHGSGTRNSCVCTSSPRSVG